MTNTINDEIDIALIKYVRAVQENHNNYMKVNYSNVSPKTLVIQKGEQFAKIIKSESGTHQSVYCFIALKDNETKGLGKVNKGDLFKPAGWRAPAKHARGNILTSFDLAVKNSGTFGIAYLR